LSGSEVQSLRISEKQSPKPLSDSSLFQALPWTTVLQKMTVVLKKLVCQLHQAILQPFEDRFIFSSKIRKTIAFDPEVFKLPGLSGIQKIQIASTVKNKKGEPIKLRGLYQAAKPGHLTILVSYGSGDSLNRIKKFANLISQGTGVMLYDHPGHGRTEGVPSEQSLYQAFKDARQYLADQGVPHKEQILYGYSMGGAVAVDSAAKTPHKALILESTMPSLADVVQNRMQHRLGQTLYSYLPIHRLLHSQFLSEEKLKNIKTPVLILHGKKDSLMPTTFADRLYTASENSMSRRLELLEGNHIMAEELTTPHIKSFLKQLG